MNIYIIRVVLSHQFRKVSQSRNRVVFSIHYILMIKKGIYVG